MLRCCTLLDALTTRVALTCCGKAYERYTSCGQTRNIIIPFRVAERSSEEDASLNSCLWKVFVDCLVVVVPKAASKCVVVPTRRTGDVTAVLESPHVFDDVFRRTSTLYRIMMMMLLMMMM